MLIHLVEQVNSYRCRGRPLRQCDFFNPNIRYRGSTYTIDFAISAIFLLISLSFFALILNLSVDLVGPLSLVGIGPHIDQFFELKTVIKTLKNTS